jgi:hypothetical protein
VNGVEMTETTRGAIALVLSGFFPPVLVYWLTVAIARRLGVTWGWKERRISGTVIPAVWWVVFGLWILRGNPLEVVVVAFAMVALAFLYGRGLEGWAEYFAQRRRRRR